MEGHKSPGFLAVLFGVLVDLNWNLPALDADCSAVELRGVKFFSLKLISVEDNTLSSSKKLSPPGTMDKRFFAVGVSSVIFGVLSLGRFPEFTIVLFAEVLNSGFSPDL